MASSDDSLCPACMEHALNLITGLCEVCGDDFSAMKRSTVRELRELAKKDGLLLDQLTVKIALDVVSYPSGGCTCDREHPQLHAVTCPASKSAERYVEHLLKVASAAEVLPIEEETPPPPAHTEGDVAFVAGLRSRLAAAAGYGDEDIRTECPECGKLLTPAGDGRVECKPCGIRLIADAGSAFDFPGAPVPMNVWRCNACSSNFSFCNVPIVKTIILGSNVPPPIACPLCRAEIELWIIVSPAKEREHGADVTELLSGKRN